MSIEFLSIKNIIPKYNDYIKLIKSNINEIKYNEIMNEINSNINYNIICVYHNNKLIGTGTILIENKLIHEGSTLTEVNVSPLNPLGFNGSTLTSVNVSPLNPLGFNGSKVGHIEDIIIDEEYRGKGIGKMLIEYLKSMCNECYKIVLYCANHNIEFYEKLGFIKKDNCMQLYK